MLKKWLCLKLVGPYVCWFNDVVLLWIRTVDIIIYIAFKLSVNTLPKIVFAFTARCLSYAACQTEPCADGSEAVNPTFLNRNPRNLEQMALAVKDRGWKTTWPHRSFYHRFDWMYYIYSNKFHFIWHVGGNFELLIFHLFKYLTKKCTRSNKWTSFLLLAANW